MSWRRGPEVHRSAVLVTKFFEFSIGWRSVAVDQRSWSNSLMDEWHQAFMIALLNLSYPDPSKSLWLDHLDSDSNKHFAGFALSANWTYRILAVGDRKIGFVYPLLRHAANPYLA